MPTIKAIIFDFDGLILDTETPDYLSWKQTYEAYGCELPQSLWTANIGTTHRFDPYTHLEELLGRPIDREEVHRQRKERDNALIAAQAVLPGVDAYLDEAQVLGLPVAIASSSPRRWVETHLDRLELRSRFPVIRGRDDVGDTPKPDPAVYRAAVAALGVSPQEALALEDSPNGAQAAKRAGLWCAAVPNGMTRHLDFDGVDYRMDALTDLPLAQLIVKVVHE